MLLAPEMVEQSSPSRSLNIAAIFNWTSSLLISMLFTVRMMSLVPMSFQLSATLVLFVAEGAPYASVLVVCFYPVVAFALVRSKIEQVLV